MQRSLPIEIVLKQNEGSFSKKEKAIADFILKNIADFEKIKVQTILKECNVGSSSLYSFFDKIHIKSIYDLWAMISKENAVRIGHENKNYSSLLQKVYLNVIDKNSQITTDNILEKFISYVLEANSIFVIGLGESNLAAIELSRRLSRFGFQAFALESEAGEMMLRAAIMKPNDLLISLSVSGETKPIVYATKMAKKNGTKIITVSGNKKSNLDALANFKINLFSAPFGNNDSTLVSPLVSYIFFIDSVISKMLDVNFSQYMNKRKNIATETSKYTKKY